MDSTVGPSNNDLLLEQKNKYSSKTWKRKTNHHSDTSGHFCYYYCTYQSFTKILLSDNISATTTTANYTCIVVFFFVKCHIRSIRRAKTSECCVDFFQIDYRKLILWRWVLEIWERFIYLISNYKWSWTVVIVQIVRR